MTTDSNAASAFGIRLRSDCGGNASCGKCRIAARHVDCLSPPSDEETAVLTEEQLASGQRLACKAMITGSGVISIPTELLEEAQTFGKTAVGAAIRLTGSGMQTPGTGT